MSENTINNAIALMGYGGRGLQDCGYTAAVAALTYPEMTVGIARLAHKINGYLDRGDGYNEPPEHKHHLLPAAQHARATEKDAPR